MSNEIFAIILLFGALCLVAWMLFTRRLKSMGWLGAIICGIIVYLIIAAFIKFSFFQFDLAIQDIMSGF